MLGGAVILKEWGRKGAKMTFEKRSSEFETWKIENRTPREQKIHMP